MTEKLPEKASDLIELALADLAKCEKDSHYNIDMGRFHVPTTSKCLVCFAGAVMAKSLGVSRKESCHPTFFEEWNERRLSALDWFRCGAVVEALRTMGVAVHEHLLALEFKDVCNYEEDREKWREDMVSLAKELRDLGE